MTLEPLRDPGAPLPFGGSSLSPSLIPSADVPAFEMKFLLSESVVEAITTRLLSRFSPDPNGEPELGGAYRIVSLYCDTPHFDVYRREAGFRRRKFRLRRYGAAREVFLERKAKWGDRVRKRRVAVASAELNVLGRAETSVDWPGHWFHRQLLARQLRPVCLVSYVRTAFIADGAEGPLRATFDRCIRGLPATEWNASAFDGGVPLVSDGVICELKFRSALPAFFKSILQEFNLQPTTVSKYRRCVEALQLVDGGSAGDG